MSSSTPDDRLECSEFPLAADTPADLGASAVSSTTHQDGTLELSPSCNGPHAFDEVNGTLATSQSVPLPKHTAASLIQPRYQNTFTQRDNHWHDAAASKRQRRTASPGALSRGNTSQHYIPPAWPPVANPLRPSSVPSHAPQAPTAQPQSWQTQPPASLWQDDLTSCPATGETTTERRQSHHLHGLPHPRPASTGGAESIHYQPHYPPPHPACSRSAAEAAVAAGMNAAAAFLSSGRVWRRSTSSGNGAVSGGGSHSTGGAPFCPAPKALPDTVHPTYPHGVAEVTGLEQQQPPALVKHGVRMNIGHTGHTTAANSASSCYGHSGVSAHYGHPHSLQHPMRNVDHNCGLGQRRLLGTTSSSLHLQTDGPSQGHPVHGSRPPPSINQPSVPSQSTLSGQSMKTSMCPEDGVLPTSNSFTSDTCHVPAWHPELLPQASHQYPVPPHSMPMEPEHPHLRASSSQVCLWDPQQQNGGWSQAAPYPGQPAASKARRRSNKSLPNGATAQLLPGRPYPTQPITYTPVQQDAPDPFLHVQCRVGSPDILQLFDDSDWPHGEQSSLANHEGMVPQNAAPQVCSFQNSFPVVQQGGCHPPPWQGMGSMPLLDRQGKGVGPCSHVSPIDDLLDEQALLDLLTEDDLL